MAVRIEIDTDPWEVEIPAVLVEALETDPEAKRAFDGLAFTHRKEYATWIAEAKRTETRERRVAQALALLRAGRTRS